MIGQTPEILHEFKCDEIMTFNNFFFKGTPATFIQLLVQNCV